ncbi:hypothetical protein AB0M48_38825 [Lentzea sp. NPDC051208]|uniref:hypothetical protein n=1 Tax=Lentzea sp. NPDC051208 TaxID=3154642 RepID=UPI00343D4A98
MGPLEYCAMLCDNTERALRAMRHDVCTAVREVEEASRSSAWTRNLGVVVKLGSVLSEIDQLIIDLDGDTACLASACLDLPHDASPVEVELLRIEMEALRHNAMASLKLLTETLPRAVDALELPAVLADTALKTSDIVVRRDIVLSGSALLHALRELVAACGSVGVPLREIVRRSTSDTWNDLQVVECLNEAVLLGLDRGLQFVLGTVDTRPLALPPVDVEPSPPRRPKRSRLIPDRAVRCVLPWWGLSYHDWLAAERPRVRNVNRFALWSGRSRPTRLFLFPAETESDEPVLLLGDSGHHPVLSRFAQYAGTLSTESQAFPDRRQADCADRSSAGVLVVGGCPPAMRDGVRHQLRQVSRKPVVFR